MIAAQKQAEATSKVVPHRTLTAFYPPTADIAAALCGRQA